MQYGNENRTCPSTLSASPSPCSAAAAAILAAVEGCAVPAAFSALTRSAYSVMVSPAPPPRTGVGITAPPGTAARPIRCCAAYSSMPHPFLDLLASRLDPAQQPPPHHKVTVSTPTPPPAPATLTHRLTHPGGVRLLPCSLPSPHPSGAAPMALLSSGRRPPPALLPSEE